MIPYGQQSIDDRDIEAVTETLGEDFITQGPRIDEFESKLSSFFKCDHSIAVNNGTMALLIAYQTLGLSNDDHVLTTPISFAATTNTAVFLGAKPNFLDINPNTFCLSLDEVTSYLSRNDPSEIAGITMVDFAGHPQKKEKLASLANEYDLFLLEDACHAPGAEWRDGSGQWHMVGSCEYVDAAVLSFHPVKHFTTGEGGAILTNSDEIASRARKLRSHGITKNPEEFKHENQNEWYYEMQVLGLNGRITDFQCALGMSQLERLPQFVEQRRTLATNYYRAFENMETIEPQKRFEDCKNSFHLFTVKAEDRDVLYDYLHENDIGAQVHYLPIYRHPYYEEKFSIDPAELPETEHYSKKAISLPLFPDLSEQDQEYVIETVREFYS